MMKQLKCDYFGKLLKPLLSTLLISCFILLGNFSNGSELCPVSYPNTPLYTFNLNEETLVNDRQSNSNFTLKSNFNFLTENSNYNGLYFFANNPWTSSYSLQTYLFWTVDGLYYAYGGSSNPSDFSSNVLGQGYINYFCKVDSIDGFCRINSVNSCSPTQGYSLISSGNVYSNTEYSNPDIMKVFATSSTMVNFCFVYTDLGFTLCAPVGTNSICASNNVCVFYSSDLLTATNTVNPSTIDESVMTFSPFGSSSDGGSDSGGSDIVFYSDTNQVYYNAFNCMGFYEGFCYSNFALDNLVNSEIKYSELFPVNPFFTGSTVFDLSDSLYPGYPSINKWYYWFYSRYKAVYGDYSKDGVVDDSRIYDLYNGYSKGNFYIFYKLLNNNFIDGYSVNPTDFQTYCDMVINGYDPDAPFNYDISRSFEDIFINSNFRNNPNNCRAYSNDNFVLSGANIDFGSGGYFSGEDMLGVFKKIFANFKNAFSVGNSGFGTIGILPRYIILGFFLFLLLYIFKR